MKNRKPPRKTSGSGSVYQDATGQWYACVSQAQPNGKLKRHRKRAKSQEQAEILLADLKAEFLPPRKLTRSSISVEQMLDRWIRDHESSWESSTLATYQFAREHLACFSSRFAGAVMPLEVQDWITGLRESKVGESVIEKAFNVFKAAFEHARRLRLVDENPCAEIRGPSSQRLKKIQIFSDEEVIAILQAVSGTHHESLFLLALTAGLRQGELFGLRWGDINWESSTLSIERAVAEVNGKLEIKAPKTAAGIRTIPLTPATVAALRRLRSSRLKSGTLSPEDPVFVTARGRLLHRSNFSRRRWKPLLKKLELAPRGFHHCRHTAASRMLRKQVPVHIVSGVLGHRDAATTWKIYAHWIPRDLQVAADAMADLDLSADAPKLAEVG